MGWWRTLPLVGWSARRREDLLSLLKKLDAQVAELDEAVSAAAQQNPKARLLMTQPGVGPVTALGFVVTIGDVSRFRHSAQLSSYLGLIPREQFRREYQHRCHHKPKGVAKVAATRRLTVRL